MSHTSSVPLAEMHINKGILRLVRSDIAQKEGRSVLRKEIFENCLVTGSTPTKTKLEDVVKNALIDKNIVALYEPYMLPIYWNPNFHAFTPDFVLPFHCVNDSVVIFEPHGMRYFSKPYLDKIKKAGETYGLHIVMISHSITDYWKTAMADRSINYWEITNPRLDFEGARSQLNDLMGEFFGITQTKSGDSVSDTLNKMRAVIIENSDVVVPIPINLRTGPTNFHSSASTILASS